MPSAWPVRLQGFPLAIEELVQPAERATGRGCETRLLLHHLPLHFDLGNRVDRFVGCG